MEDVIGGHGSPKRFAQFLDNWQAILTRRVDQAAAAFSPVPGVRGLILAGGVGRGAAWPLSDIDIFPIYDDQHIETARAEVERRRLALLKPWIAEGWWTGLDIGKLAFSAAEVTRVLGDPTAPQAALLADDRWYHALDKGFGSRPLYDPEGLAAALCAWLTSHRFSPTVVPFRLDRARHELATALRQLHAALARKDLPGAVAQTRSAVRWLQTGLLETWGERDNSQGRLGTRFARIAGAHGQTSLVRELDAVSDLDDRNVLHRMAAAPTWVQERHDRSWRARTHVDEGVTRLHLQDARDTLRVCSLYALRQPPSPPYPAWLAISPDPTLHAARARTLARLTTDD